MSTQPPSEVELLVRRYQHLFYRGNAEVCLHGYPEDYETRDYPYDLPPAGLACGASGELSAQDPHAALLFERRGCQFGEHLACSSWLKMAFKQRDLAQFVEARQIATRACLEGKVPVEFSRELALSPQVLSPPTNVDGALSSPCATVAAHYWFYIWEFIEEENNGWDAASMGPLEDLGLAARTAYKGCAVDRNAFSCDILFSTESEINRRPPETVPEPIPYEEISSIKDSIERGEEARVRSENYKREREIAYQEQREEEQNEERARRASEPSLSETVLSGVEQSTRQLSNWNQQVAAQQAQILSSVRPAPTPVVAYSPTPVASRPSPRTPEPASPEEPEQEAVPAAGPAATRPTQSTPASTPPPVAAPPETSEVVTHPAGLFDHCLAFFFDRDHYNWYAMRNDCGEPLYVNYGTRQAGAFATDIGVGKTSSTGWTEAYMQEVGRPSVAACRAGFEPVDGSGKTWRPGKLYRCKQR